jgi:hypothetical protein
LIGERKTLDAFNEAWGFLHELAHVVENSNDAEKIGDVGDCELLINQMRRELSLEERGEYFFTAARGTGDFATQLVRLEFIESGKDGRTRRHWLMWDARLVGSGTDESQATVSRR